MKQSGFSLIEIMVGMVVGLLVILAAMGGASFYEANRRTSIGSNSAQENVVAAASFIQQAGKMAGLWIAADFSCNTINRYNGSAYVPIGVDASSGRSTSFMGAPVAIRVGGGTNNGDSVEIFFSYSDDPSGSPLAVLTKQKTGSDFEVTISTGVLSDYFGVGDIVLLMPPPEDLSRNCTMGVITQVQDSSGHLQMRPYGNINGQPSDPVLDFPVNSRIARMNVPPVQRTFRVSNNNFEMLEGNLLDLNSGITPIPTPVRTILAENVIKILARYASNTAGDGLTAASWPPLGDVCAANNQFAANAQSYVLSVILVARSPQPEKHQQISSADTATNCNATTDATLPKDWDGNSISVVNGADPTRADGAWQCYHYKAIQFDVPLRNLILRSRNERCLP